jgi:hypothetical protein
VGVTEFITNIVTQLTASSRLVTYCNWYAVTAACTPVQNKRTQFHRYCSKIMVTYASGKSPIQWQIGLCFIFVYFLEKITVIIPMPFLFHFLRLENELFFSVNVFLRQPIVFYISCSKFSRCLRSRWLKTNYLCSLHYLPLLLRIMINVDVCWYTFWCYKLNFPIIYGTLLLRFPLPILIPPTAPHSSSSINRGWYNRPNSGRRTNWTVSPHPHELIWNTSNIF